MTKNILSIQIIGSLLFVFISIACNGKNNASKIEDEQTNHKETMENNHSHSEHGFSEKISIEEIAKKLESPERDELEQPEKLIQYIGDLKGKTLMDIGAGTGYYSLKIADKGAFVIAADVNEQLQNYLKQKIEKKNIKNVELRKTQADNPLLKDKEVDIVFIANAFHHIENRTAYFGKVKKGLKENGELVIVDYFIVEIPKEITAPPMKMRVSIDQAVFELKKSGFTFFKIDVNLLSYHYIIKAK